jgi:hypothetical protein
MGNGIKNYIFDRWRDVEREFRHIERYIINNVAAENE